MKDWQEWLKEWQKNPMVEAIYLLPTSTKERKDILILLRESELSFFERLERLYPKERREPDLQIFPLTQEELSRWGKAAQKTLKRANLLWQRP